MSTAKSLTDTQHMELEPLCTDRNILLNFLQVVIYLTLASSMYQMHRTSLLPFRTSIITLGKKLMTKKHCFLKKFGFSLSIQVTGE